ncbi:MAG: GspE/PulE family protein [Myxococcales bacterium]
MRTGNLLVGSFALGTLFAAGAIFFPIIEPDLTGMVQRKADAGAKGVAAKAKPVAKTLTTGLEAIASAARTDRRAHILAGIAAVSAAGAILAGRRRRRLLELAAPAPPQLQPGALIDPVGVREELLRFGVGVQEMLRTDNPDLVKILDLILECAIRVGASDVHFQPLETATRVYCRVGGVLEDVLAIPIEFHPRLVMRSKVLARLVTFVSDRPQDGSFSFNSSSGTTDMRVSVLPTKHGEKIVLRIARSGAQMPQLETLGFPAETLERLHSVLARPQGLIFLAGPTGSGKTTTIYAALSHIRNTRGETTQIATIEDPIEFEVSFLSQTQVRPDAGLTFADGLRALLRQDPNVMMVGEIRDAETARIAIQAGLSGHLILTTVHADSAAGVFNRLIEMGIEPFLLASASQAALSQRLVRTLCPHCRRRVAVTEQQAKRLEAAGLSLAQAWEPVGCARCAGRGYIGRTAIVELLDVTERERRN